MQLYALFLIPVLLSLGLVALAMGSWGRGAMAKVALALGLAALALSVYGALAMRETVNEVQRALGGLQRFGDGLDRGIPGELKERLGQ